MTVPVTVDDFIELKLVHEVHTSERRSFRACRRRWNWLFNKGYYPLVTAKPLEFGVSFHKAMEVYYEPETWAWDKEVVAANAVLAFVEKCEEQKKRAIETTGHLYLDDELEGDYAERVDLGKGMLNYYFSQVAPVLDKGWKPAFVEVGFMVPVKNPETGADVIWCKCDRCWDKYSKSEAYQTKKAEVLAECRGCKNSFEEFGEAFLIEHDFKPGHWEGLPVVYAGRIDMLAQDNQGNYWIFDWKTCRNIAERYDFLYLDDQIGSYVWALKKILELPIKGFIYHEQRKGYPQPPKQNKVRRLGCLFSVAKNQDVDYEIYLKTVQEKDREAYEAGYYDEMLDYLKNEGIVYYSRHQIIKTAVELDEIERNIGLEILDIVDPALRIYPSAGRFGCSFCAFQQPCLDKNGGGDYKYVLNELYEIREPYYIRNEPSTESKGGE
jgi:hypothetical protein